jgi:hypothetical protein
VSDFAEPTAPEPVQLDLLAARDDAAQQPDEEKGEAVQQVLSEVRKRFGGRALFPAGHGKS